MNSADLHPCLFTHYCDSFRTNVLRAIRLVNARWKDMQKACYVDAMTFCMWVNNKADPEVDEIELLVGYLKTIGYEWR